MKLRVLIVVTHLLGVGHLARAALIARALDEAGASVRLVSGGKPSATVDLSGLDVVQLAPIHCEGADFKTLRNENGGIADEAYLASRRDAMLDAYAKFKPDVLVTELFPFGRRQLAMEFLALLEAARATSPRPAILCSIRDILQPPSKPSRAAQTLERLGRFYDGVLVHADESVISLDASWPVDKALARRLEYTGFVADRARARALRLDAANGGEIVVSGGGSAAALRLFAAALEAAKGDRRRWHILIGHGVEDKIFHEIVAAAPANASVERARRDFPSLLNVADVSVSQAGYNTVIDILATGARAVLVPFEEGGEKEQRMRAEHLAAQGRAIVVSQAALAPATLIGAIEEVMSLPQPGSAATIMLDGAGVAAKKIAGAAARAFSVTAAWDTLHAALEEIATNGETLAVWWRDDDVVAPSPALDRLLLLSERFEAPVALAAIPLLATEALAERLAEEPRVDVIVHGLAHRNHSPQGQSSSELGIGQPLLDRMAALYGAHARLQRLFGPKVVPMLAPPWNRIGEDLVRRLNEAGFAALSTFKRRRAREAAPGVLQVNTHVDPVFWRGHGGLRDEAAMLVDLAALALETVARAPDDREPIGLLTHHLEHDPWVWRFVEELLGFLAAHRAVRFTRPAEFLAERKVSLASSEE
ncbi:MAG TPA: glycosyltransferase [Beijerinckiaceae bacterium]|jgi:predicted glycosyltransferase|nr:glycosyltransferase [Beijerinckiaceae bacterium]